MLLACSLVGPPGRPCQYTYHVVIGSGRPGILMPVLPHTMVTLCAVAGVFGGTGLIQSSFAYMHFLSACRWYGRVGITYLSYSSRLSSAPPAQKLTLGCQITTVSTPVRLTLGACHWSIIVHPSNAMRGQIILDPLNNPLDFSSIDLLPRPPLC